MRGAFTEAVEGAQTVVVGAGEGVDPDAVGAAVALVGAIRARWPEKTARVRFGEAVPSGSRFLMEGVDREVPAELDLVVLVDCGPERLGAFAGVFGRATVRAQIDHHRSATGQGVDVAWLDATAASTTQMVAQLCDAWGVALDRRIAEAVYAGLVFDTGGFRYALTSPETLRLAARCLEAGIDHARIVESVLLEQSVETLRLRGTVASRVQVVGHVACAWLDWQERRGVAVGGLVDDLVFLEGVEVGLLAVGRADGRTKVSLRSRGAVDVAAVAKGLSAGGGGHFRAAGATVEGTPEAVARAVQGQLTSSV